MQKLSMITLCPGPCQIGKAIINTLQWLFLPLCLSQKDPEYSRTGDICSCCYCYWILIYCPLISFVRVITTSALLSIKMLVWGYLLRMWNSFSIYSSLFAICFLICFLISNHINKVCGKISLMSGILAR